MFLHLGNFKWTGVIRTENQESEETEIQTN